LAGAGEKQELGQREILIAYCSTKVGMKAFSSSGENQELALFTFISTFLSWHFFCWPLLVFISKFEREIILNL